MSVDETRLKYGDEAEDAVLNYFNSFGVEMEKRLAIEGNKKSIYENMKFGDLFLTYKEIPNRAYNFDVKRGCFVSHRSLTEYRGQFYILIPNGDLSDLGKAKIFKSSTLKSYYSNVPSHSRHTGISGDQGYRFTKLKNFILLEEFVPELIKRLYILGDKWDPTKCLSPMGELNLMFNKVLPRGRDHTEYLERYGRYVKHE